MLTLEANEWVFLNNLIYTINSESDEIKVRKAVLERLRMIIDYDAADFFVSGKAFLISDKECLADPVYFNCVKNLSAEYDSKDYSRGVMYSGKASVYRETDIISDEERKQTDYYKAIYVANRWHYSLQLVFAMNGVFLGAASFYRNVGKADFTYEDVFIADSLKDHISLRLYNEMLKRSDEAAVKPSVNEVAEKYNLTKHEKIILRLLMDGKSHPEICEELVITNNTLKKHIQNIYRKIGVTGRVDLFKKIREKE